MKRPMQEGLLGEKSSNTEFFLVLIFLHLDLRHICSVNLRIQSDYKKISTGKKIRIWTFFTQWFSTKLVTLVGQLDKTAKARDVLNKIGSSYLETKVKL